jgi:hypothetical protein
VLALPDENTGPSKESEALSALRRKMVEREALLKEKKGRSAEHEALRRGSLADLYDGRANAQLDPGGGGSGADSESKIVDLADLADLTGSPIHGGGGKGAFVDPKIGAFARRTKNPTNTQAYLPGSRETAI